MFSRLLLFFTISAITLLLTMPTTPSHTCGLFQNEAHRLPGARVLRIQGMTLLEVMVSFIIFTMVAMGTLTAVVQSRKMSEDNVAQATATVIAQGILEQVQLATWDTLTDPTLTDTTQPNYLNLALRFAGTSTSNLASIQQFQLPWETDATIFDPIGAYNTINDPTSGVKGILIDTEYLVASTVLRPPRFMKMQVNLARTIHTNEHNIEVVLTYRWQPPSRNLGTGTPTWLTRQLRTIKSEAESY